MPIFGVGKYVVMIGLAESKSAVKDERIIDF